MPPDPAAHRALQLVHTHTKVRPEVSAAALLAGLLLLLLSVESFAQHLPIRTYTIADGLAHDQVDKIVQDSRGFMWFCTMDGLSRFDGYRFTNYGVKDGLPAARINDMLESGRDGVYWVATNGGGVSRFDPRADARLVAAATDGAGTAATDGGGHIFNLSQVGDESQSNVVEMLYEDRAGNIWAGTQGGLFRLSAGREGGKFERVELSIAARAERALEVQSMFEDAEGSLWIGTNRGVVRRLPDGRVIHHPVLTSQGTDYVWAFLSDGEGRLWLGHQAGLMILKPEPSARAAANAGGISPLRVAGERGDASNLRDGRLVLPASEGEAHWYTTADGLAFNNVQALHKSSDGRIWVGTRGGGVSVFDGARFRNYTAAHGLSSRVNALAEDRDGNVWVGTQASGAARHARRRLSSHPRGRTNAEPPARPHQRPSRRRRPAANLRAGRIGSAGTLTRPRTGADSDRLLRPQLLRR